MLEYMIEGFKQTNKLTELPLIYSVIYITWYLLRGEHESGRAQNPPPLLVSKLYWSDTHEKVAIQIPIWLFLGQREPHHPHKALRKGGRSGGKFNQVSHKLTPHPPTTTLWIKPGFTRVTISLRSQQPQD